MDGMMDGWMVRLVSCHVMSCHVIHVVMKERE
jgi:hypothetical protein